MLSFIAKAAFGGLTIALVATIAKRYPGWGGLLAALPLTSILALSLLWVDTRQAEPVAAPAQEQPDRARRDVHGEGEQRGVEDERSRGAAGDELLDHHFIVVLKGLGGIWKVLGLFVQLLPRFLPIGSRGHYVPLERVINTWGVDDLLAWAGGSAPDETPDG